MWIALFVDIEYLHRQGTISCCDRCARGPKLRYVGRLIRLAFLAPDIVESIVEGRHPTTLTAEVLTRRIELPLSWCTQRTVLNVEKPGKFALAPLVPNGRDDASGGDALCQRLSLIGSLRRP